MYDVVKMLPRQINAIFLFKIRERRRKKENNKRMLGKSLKSAYGGGTNLCEGDFVSMSMHEAQRKT